MLADMLRDIMSLMGIPSLHYRHSLSVSGIEMVRFKWQGKFYRLTIEEVDKL